MRGWRPPVRANGRARGWPADRAHAAPMMAISPEPLIAMARPPSLPHRRRLWSKPIPTPRSPPTYQRVEGIHMPRAASPHSCSPSALPGGPGTDLQLYHPDRGRAVDGGAAQSCGFALACSDRGRARAAVKLSNCIIAPLRRRRSGHSRRGTRRGCRHPGLSAADPMDVYGSVPSFDLTDQSRTAFASQYIKQYKGHVLPFSST